MVKKDCFGILDKVFPVGENGLREIVHECFNCPDRTQCLRAALFTEEGLKMKDEILDRAAAGGMIGRVKLWSQKKNLSRLIRKGREKKRRRDEGRDNLSKL